MQNFEHFGSIVEYIEKMPDNPKALNLKKQGVWYPTSTKDFVYNLKRLTYGLVALGINRGDKVGIMSTPSPHWILSDLAIILAGGISVPLFAKISDDNFIYEVAQSNIRFLFVNGTNQWKKFIRHRSLFETVIGMDGEDEPEESTSLYEVMKKGEELWHKEPTLFDQLLLQLKGDDVATIVYTSGSTGAPKGAELTHKNLIHLITQDVFSWKPNEKYLSILPLAHIFARQIIYIMLTWRVSIYFLNDLTEFAETCRELRPELMIVVPRLLEKVYDGMTSRMLSRGWLQKKIGLWAVCLAEKERFSLFDYLQFPLAKFLVYRRLKKAIGNRWRIILCGGAKLDVTLYRFYLRIGIPIYEGWGLTEGSTACVNRPGHIKVGTVGPPLPGIQVKIADQDEILVGGPTVMKGYFRYPRETKRAIDAEGWLHTGDKGKIDRDGFLTIIGRLKEQFKLSTGEYVVPGRIEQMIAHYCPFIDMALVIGEGESFAGCLLFPDMDEVQKLKKEHEMEALNDADFLQTEVVKKQIHDLLQQVNGTINRFERILTYRFILDPLTVEAGDLTPTMKIKRAAVQEKYKDIIQAMYSEEE